MNKLLFVLSVVAACAVVSLGSDSSSNSGSELSEDCKYVNDNYFLLNVSRVRNCFLSYKINETFVDAIIRNIEYISKLYPYVEISKNPPKSSDKSFPVVDWDAEVEALKETLKNADGNISKIFRSTQAFIAGLHDAHTFLNFGLGKIDNIFALVGAAVPFFWNIYLDDDNNSRILLEPTPVSQLTGFAELLAEKYDNKIYVKSVDGKDPIDFFVNFFEEYECQRFNQAIVSNAIIATGEGFQFLRFPTENALINHTLVFDDDTILDFSCVFANAANPPPKMMRDLGIKFNIPRDPIADNAMSPDDVMHSVEEIKEAFKKVNLEKPISRSNLNSHQYLPCGMMNDMNYIIISTFSADTNVYVQELSECVSYFYQNENPITIWMNHNGGGKAALMEVTQLALLTDSDPRILAAFRKTDATRRIFVDEKYGGGESNMSNKCLYNNEDFLYEAWEETVQDHYEGGIIHNRTNKMFLAYKDYAQEVYKITQGKRLRKPTDIIVATDGFCASGCAIFTYNAKRTGSAIVAGYGAALPNEDPHFVLGQCYATTIRLNEWFNDFANNSLYGLDFGVTLAEMYDVSEDMKELIPNEFDTPRVDENLYYFRNSQPVLGDILNKTKEIYKKYNTTCNPDNKRLVYMTDDCHVDDPNALTFGYICGDDGYWNKSSCRILTCQPMYALDSVNNKCIPNLCDGRSIFFDSSSVASSAKSSAVPPPLSGSSSMANTNTIYPSLGLMVTIVSILFISF